LTSMDAILILVVVILAVASVVWYFRMRRRMIRFLRDFTVELEEVFKPRDKEYMLLGYLVGYKATYKLRDGSRAYILLTTTPRHSLFYYPIAAILGREDRVEIALQPSRGRVLREAHAVRRGEYRLKLVLRKDLGEELAKLNTSTVNTQNGVYELYYENPEDVNLILEIINDRSIPVYKLSAYKKQNLVEIVSRAELGKVKYLYEKLRYYMERVTEET